ncbi:MAG: MoaD/ThiS family protein, partial [Pyrinomonadaceae bacterium]
MSVTILFFGATAEITGQRKIEMNFVHGLPAREIFVRILERYPELSTHKLLLSVNHQYSTGNEIIRGGDEIAIFTA